MRENDVTVNSKDLKNLNITLSHIAKDLYDLNYQLRCQNEILKKLLDQKEA